MNIKTSTGSVVSTSYLLRRRDNLNGLVQHWRLVLPVILLMLLFADSTRDLVIHTISDAFFQVGVFVAATLAVYHFIREKLSGYRRNWLSDYDRLRIPYAALLGCLPGCGGAIIVVTQFLQGQLSFGAVVAVLTATMGDAAFLLLAARPVDGLLLMGIAFVTAVISGQVIDRVHPQGFMSPKQQKTMNRPVKSSANSAAVTMWKLLLVPGTIFGLLMAMQVDVAELIKIDESLLIWGGALLGIIAVLFWAVNSRGHSYQEVVSESDKAPQAHWSVAMTQDTNFVLAWVVVAFLLFELTVKFIGLDLGLWLSQFSGLLPLMAILIGLLPGCGPQIIVTSVYLQGAIPFSAQLGNAISNDGDALFPAIAMAPKLALLATVYSAVPAVLVAYGYFFIFE